jgi:XTP/dITP diphosphohydrolase
MVTGNKTFIKHHIMSKSAEAFDSLIEVMNQLREKCPWDAKQTIESLRHMTIEETYELADAIIENNPDHIKEELGDLIMHIVFYAHIANEKDFFDIKDVINGVVEKLIRRHPHVFGDVSVNDAEDVKKNWEEIKLSEGKKTVLGGVPKSLPAMVKSHRIQDKARAAGFDWEKREDVWLKVKEEIGEVEEAIAGLSDEEREKEFGDLLFSVINAARLYNIDPEAALEKTNQKFIRRFNYIESKAGETGRHVSDMKLEEMDAFWNEAKSKE